MKNRIGGFCRFLPFALLASGDQRPLIMEAQTQPAPGLQWVSDHTHEDDRSESGTYYSINWNGSNVPEGVEQAWVRVHDLQGRTIVQRRIGAGAAIVELDLAHQPAAVYAAELSLDGVRSGTVKLMVE